MCAAATCHDRSRRREDCATDAFREGTRAAAITPANVADVYGGGEGPAEAMAEWLAGFDEGLLSLSLPIIVYIENSYMDKIYSDE